MIFLQRAIVCFVIFIGFTICLKAQDHAAYLSTCRLCYDTLVVDPYYIPPAESIRKIDEAITALREVQPIPNIALAKCLHTKANYLSNQSKFRASTACDMEAEAAYLASDSLSAHLELSGWIYNLIAYNAEQTFDYSKAILYSEKTQQIAIEIGDSLAIVNEYNNLCKAYTNLGDFEKALLCHQSGMSIIEVLEKSGRFPKEAFTAFKAVLNNSLAILYIQQAGQAYNKGRKKESEIFNNKTRAVYNSLLNEESSSYQQNYNIIYSNLGASFVSSLSADPFLLDTALLTLRKADSLFAMHVGFAESALHGHVKSLLGYVYSTVDYKKSIEYFDACLQMNQFYPTESRTERSIMLEKAPIQNRLLVSLLNLSAAYYQFYQKSNDIDDLQKSYTILNDLVADVDYLSLSQLSSDAIIAQRNLLESIYLSAIKTALLLFEQTNELHYFEEGFSFMEKHNSFILRQGIRKRYFNQQRTDGAQHAILKMETFFENKYRDLRYQLAHETSLEKRGAIIDTLLEHQQRRQTFINDLKNSDDVSKRALFYDRHDHSTPSLNSVKENYLSTNEALISYSIGSSSPLALVVWKDSQLVVRLKIDDLFWTSFDRLQQCAQNECGSNQYAEAAYNVYDRILKDVVAQLPAQINTLLIMPDNELRALSFDMLLTASGRSGQNTAMPFLIKDYALKYCYSIGTLEWIRQLKSLQIEKKQKSIAGFIASPGSGGFGNASCSTMPLPYLSAGTKEIMKYFPEEERTLFPIATRSDFIEHCSRYKILHIAAHGCIGAGNPMDYFLQFASDKDDPADNKLTIKYIYDSLEVNADLLVLASCNTKNGRLEGGEGLASICRAFVQSGVGQVLVTLHEVNDYTSGKLLLYFYEELIAKELTPTIALANAKRRYLNDETIEDQFKAPNFWSNFVLIGDD